MQELAKQVRAVMIAADTYRRSMAVALGVGVTEASALGEIRQDAALTGRALARLCGWHESKVSRIEHAKTAPSADDIRALFA